MGDRKSESELSKERLEKIRSGLVGVSDQVSAAACDVREKLLAHRPKLQKVLDKVNASEGKPKWRPKE